MSDVRYITNLGNFEIIETYVFYDEPVLFSCRNESGKLYLGVFSDKTQNDETWLYARVSIDRLKQIRTGEIDLYTALTDPEDEFLFMEVIPYGDEAECTMTIAQPNTIPKDILPIQGNRLDLDSDTFPVLDNLDLEVIPIDGTTLDIKAILDSNEYVTAGILGDFLRSFQSVINSIGRSETNYRIDTKRFKKQMELSVLGMSMGSFNIKLAPKKDSSLAESALLQFVDIIESGDDEDKLQNIFSKLSYDSVDRYKQFLSLLGDSVKDTTFTWSSSTRNINKIISLSNSNARRLSEVLIVFTNKSVETLSITGRLIGISLKNRKFELQTSNKVFSGRIDNAITKLPDNLIINKFYQADIQKTDSIINNEVKTEYFLSSLSTR